MLDLAHGGVDDGEAGAAFSPQGEEVCIVFPVDVCEFGFEAFVHTVIVRLIRHMSMQKRALTRCMASVRGRACRNRARQLR